MSQWTKASGARLARAVRELAAAEPIHEITVAALCQAAGVTRDTFYRYAASPIDVLGAAMSLDLPDIDELVASIGSDDVASPLEAPGLAVIEHIERNRAIYRNALHPHLDSALREVLNTRIEGLLAAYLAAHPSAVPAIDDIPANRNDLKRITVFTAAGIVGAIEEWLAETTPDAPERMLALLFTAAAPWWRRTAPS